MSETDKEYERIVNTMRLTIAAHECNIADLKKQLDTYKRQVGEMHDERDKNECRSGGDAVRRVLELLDKSELSDYIAESLTTVEVYDLALELIEAVRR